MADGSCEPSKEGFFYAHKKSRQLAAITSMERMFISILPARAFLLFDIDQNLSCFIPTTKMVETFSVQVIIDSVSLGHKADHFASLYRYPQNV